MLPELACRVLHVHVLVLGLGLGNAHHRCCDALCVFYISRYWLHEMMESIGGGGGHCKH